MKMNTRIWCFGAVFMLVTFAFAQAQSSVTTKKAIQEAQQRLQVLGYEPGSADGSMGARTIAALKKFQSDHGLAVTGGLDQKTLAALASTSPAALLPAAKPPAKAVPPSAEETDWAETIMSGTSDSYIAFHSKYPTSSKLTVRTGAIKWGHGMHRGDDDSQPIPYVLDSISIGDFSASFSVQEAAILGVIKLRDNGNGSVSVVMDVVPPSDAVVLFKDGKVVACQSAATPLQTPTAKVSDRLTGLDDAVRNGDLGRVRALLKDDVDLVSRRNGSGSTPLHLAAATSHKEIAEFLLANRADISAKANDGTTPLHQAAFDGSRDVASLLIANGADIEAKENNGYTPLHAAAVMGRKEVAEFLLANKADVNARGNNGYTPLHLAVGRGHTDVAELLRQHGGHE
jgi:hypothetical protein